MFRSRRDAQPSGMSAETKNLFVACAGDSHPAGLHPYGIAKRMIEKGADVNFKCSPEELMQHRVLAFSNCFNPWSGDFFLTPLFVACFHGETDVVRLLLRHGARDGRALYTAVESRFPLIEERRHEKFEIAKMLIRLGYDARFRGSSGRTALCAAAEAGCLDTAKLLIDHGAVVGDCRCSPLYMACRATGSSEPGREAALARLLLENGANPEDCYDEDGYSLLKWDSEIMKVVREYQGEDDGDESSDDDRVLNGLSRLFV